VTDGRTDGQTDGRTESIIAKTALCIASYADALSKIGIPLFSFCNVSKCRSNLMKIISLCSLGIYGQCFFYCSRFSPNVAVCFYDRIFSIGFQVNSVAAAMHWFCSIAIQ